MERLGHGAEVLAQAGGLAAGDGQGARRVSRHRDPSATAPAAAAAKVPQVAVAWKPVW